MKVLHSDDTDHFIASPVVDHGVVVIPEDVLRGPHRVPELAGDGHAGPEGDVLLPRPQDGGRGLVDPQPRGQGLHPGGGRGLKWINLCYYRCYTRVASLMRLSLNHDKVLMGRRLERGVSGMSGIRNIRPRMQ